MYMRLSWSIEPTKEQIMVLFWIILYKNIVSTIFCGFLTTCQTFKELSSPHDTILFPRAERMIPATDDLFVGRLYATLPWAKLYTFIFLS